MTPILSPNTQAILLLTAPLIAGRGTSSSELLSPGEYKRLARHLREIQRQPADLVSPDAADLLRACQPVIDEARLQRLLGRGFLLSQVIERWQARAIWVVSRADAEYPRRLKARLREDAPAVIYGCGDMSLLESGGLAVVGSRDADDALIDYTMAVGRLAARAGRTLISGGAKGIDQAAMRGALEAGGKVSGVLADSLENTTMNREHRNLLLDAQLVLISPYDPSAGFNVGHAMQRNKLIYALADASLVVSSDLSKGGTWAGATEQLTKLRFIPVYVRSTGEPSTGLQALIRQGALLWPNPQNADELQGVLAAAEQNCSTDMQVESELGDESQPSLFGEKFPLLPTDTGVRELSASSAPIRVEGKEETQTESFPHQSVNEPIAMEDGLGWASKKSPADELFDAVSRTFEKLLAAPMSEADIAGALRLSPIQTKTWIRKLVDDGLLEKLTKPTAYVVKQPSLFR